MAVPASPASPASPGVPRSRILGTGHFLPPGVRTNADLSRMVDTSDEWITERTGIKERRIAPDGMVTSDMAAAAGKFALEAAGLDASQLDMIIVGTVTGDMPMPATAAFVQQKLGAGTCPAFDLSAACAGFIYGLSIADQFISTGRMKHVLVIGVELLSRVIDWTDRTTCVLFGDGAGAAVLGPANPAATASDAGVLSTFIQTDGSLAPSLWIPGGGSATPATHASVEDRKHFVHMRGQDIFKSAVKNLHSASVRALELAGMAASEVTWVCAHQANKRIIDQVVARLEVTPEKVLMNIERTGNTSSASIPILLDQSIHSKVVRPGDSVLMCALGAGISWGSAVVRM
jgi:3-oxoacyl-[acyl-carrier-protein] synthase-3